MKLSSSLLKISEKNTILWTKRKKIQSLKETMRTSRILSNPFSPSLALLLLKNSRSLKPLQRMIISISWNLLIGPTWKAISQGWALCSRILSKEGRIIGKSILVLLMVPKSWRIFRMMMTKCLESKIIRSTRKNRTSRNWIRKSRNCSKAGRVTRNLSKKRSEISLETIRPTNSICPSWSRLLMRRRTSSKKELNCSMSLSKEKSSMLKTSEKPGSTASR